MKQIKTLTKKDYDFSSVGLNFVTLIVDSKTSIGLSGSVQQQVVGDCFGIYPFYIRRGPLETLTGSTFALNAPTTNLNALRLMRALQLTRPILLEGSPGVGKTSLVAALAKAAGHPLVRINLSDQTDVTDLFGADLPVEGGKGGEFAWRDGPLLAALQAGHWIVLDELNLASQSVLEGLNSCLDHRSEVFIPELGKTFHIQHQKTRIFACQNPLSEGSGRKGLPKSFLNRFTQVHIEKLTKTDLLYIVESVYPLLSKDIIAKMVEFNQTIYNDAIVERAWAQKGGPWEFNLRDLFRWCDLMIANQAEGMLLPREFVSLVYSQRMRTMKDRELVCTKYEETFREQSLGEPVKQVIITREFIQIGNAVLRRKENGGRSQSRTDGGRPLRILNRSLEPLCALMNCISMNWLAILIGSSGTGKTSMVKLLAQLTGNHLEIMSMNSAIDTTELLGGFEQADLNRHLEMIFKQIQTLLYGIIASLVCSSSRDVHDASCTNAALSDAQDLFSKLESITVSTNSNTNHDTSADEFKNVLGKIQSILDLLSRVREISSKMSIESSVTNEINRLSGCLNDIKNRLEVEKSLSHDGRFEWIDSVLVQCLQSGHWLLIDNVNFCSASVLDRLNALLEPNGVLTVSERGVVDGQVPSITPHKDFRLIFTMDARNGEISRAMRNRGVEIYILNEADGNALFNVDTYDTRILLSDLGIVEEQQARALISVHQAVQTCSAQLEHVDLSSLIHCAELAAQQISTGRKQETALYDSMIEVYAHGRMHKSDIAELIAIKLKEEMNNVTISRMLPLNDSKLWTNSMPTASDWGKNVTAAGLKQHSTVLVRLLELINLKFVEDKLSADDSLTVVQLQAELVSMLHPAAKLFVESCSIESGPLLVEYIKRITGHEITKSDSKELVVAKKDLHLHTEMKKIIEGLAAVYCHSALAQIKNCTSSLDLGGAATALKQLPFDWRSCQSFVDKVKVELARSNKLQRVKSISETYDLSNHLYVIQCAAMLDTELKEMISSVESGTTRRMKLPECSLILLSLSLQPDGTVQNPLSSMTVYNKIDKSCISSISPLLSTLLSEVIKQLDTPQRITDDERQQLIKRFDWLRRFSRLCGQPMGTSNMELVHSKMSLHWNWVYSKLVNYLSSKQFKFSGELSEVISKLNRSFGSAQAFKIHESILNQHGQCRPFGSEQEVASYEKIAALFQELDVETCESKNEGGLARETAAIQFLIDPSVSQLKEQILELHYLLTSSLSVEEMLDRCSTISRIVEDSLTRRTVVPEDSDQNKVTPSAAICNELAILPLMESIALRQEGHLLSTIFSSGSDCMSFEHQTKISEQVKEYLHFCCRHTSFAPSTLCDLRDLVKDGTDRHGYAVRTFFSHAKSSLACQELCRWLAWKCSTVTRNQHAHAVESYVPVSTYSWNLSFNVVSLVTDNPEATATSSGISLSGVSLYECEEKFHQLGVLKRLLWAHAASLSSDNWDLRDNSRTILLKCLCHLLKSIRAYLPVGVATPVDVFTSSACMNSDLKDLLKAFEDCSKETSTTDGLAILLPSWRNHLLDCLLKISDYDSVSTVAHSHLPGSVGSNNAYWKSLAILGVSWIDVGLFQAHVLAPQGPVDPTQRRSVKMQYVRDELKCIERELQVRQWNSTIQSGNDLDKCHPFVVELLHRQTELDDWVEKTTKKVAFRSDESHFLSMLRSVKQFLSSISAVEKSTELVRHLMTAFDGDTLESMSTAVCEARLYSQSCSVFVKSIHKSYSQYRDLLSAFLSAVLQMQYGFELLCQAVSVKLANAQLVPSAPFLKKISLEDVIFSLTSFSVPSARFPSSLDIVRMITSDDFFLALNHFEKLSRDDTNNVEIYTSFKVKTMRSALLQLLNHAGSSGSLDQSTLNVFQRVVNQFVSEWNRLQLERKQMEEDDASLYRFVTHGDGLTEEQKDEIEIRAQFPSFAGDFHDITVGFTLDDASAAYVPTNTAVRAKLDTELHEANMDIVKHVHVSFFKQLTSCSWHQGDPSVIQKEVNLTRPMMLSYEVAAQIIKGHSGHLNPQGERSAISMHLLATNILQESIRSSSVDNSSLSAPYDIYHDANVEEAVKCRPLLEKLVVRVRELLNDWPEYPTLVQLETIIMRIMNFPVTSILMRFMEGLETLLAKAQEWQKNASSDVSLASHLNAITLMIISWRKLELNCVKFCLDSVAYKVHRKASLWWCHIYQVLESYLNDTVQNDDDVANDPESLLPLLHNFMKDSCVGEYAIRLDILLGFHLHLVQVSRTKTCETTLHQTINIVWNVHQYYFQFLPSVEAYLQKSRAPIEQQVKDFVKISRWGDRDTNFYAVKAAVDKSHQTIHKHMKQFKAVLLSEVKSILTDAEVEWAATATGQNDAVTPRLVFDCDVSVFILPGIIESTTGGSDDFRLNVSKRTKVMSACCEEIVAIKCYPPLVNAVEGFTREVIEYTRELQALNVEHIKEKDKIKKQIAHISQLKRKALSDLFKQLKVMGLSYRKGLAKLKLDEKRLLESFIQPPCIMSVALPQLQTQDCDDALIQAWKGCDEYFYRSVSRRVMLHNALLNPSKELGPIIIERCKGFCEHLMVEFEDQRCHLVSQFNVFVQFRKLVDRVHQLNGQTSIPPQDASKKWLNVLHDHIHKALQCVGHLQISLKCAPKNKNNTNVDFVSPVANSCRPPISAATQEDELWRLTFEKVQQCEAELCLLRKWVCAEVSSDKFIMKDVLKNGEESFVKLENIMHILSGVEVSFLLPNSDESCCLTSSVAYLVPNILNASKEFRQFVEIVRQSEAVPPNLVNPENIQNSDILARKFKADLKFLKEKCFKVVEEFVKQTRCAKDAKESKHAEMDKIKSQINVDEKTEELETENGDVGEDGLTDMEGLLTEKIGSTLTKDINCLRLPEITTHLQTVLSQMNTWSSETALQGLGSAAVLQLHAQTEVYTQYGHLVQYYLLQRVDGIRATGKFLSVLLGLFATLALKVICLYIYYTSLMVIVIHVFQISHFLFLMIYSFYS